VRDLAKGILNMAIRRPKKRGTISALSSLGLLSLAPAVHAAWDFVPNISMSAGTQDNVLLEQTDKQSATSLTADAAFTLANFTQRGTLVVSPRILADSYADNEQKAFETEDKFLDASGRYDWRRVGVGFRSNYSEEIFINSEFAEVIPNDPDLDPGEDFTDTDPDTGRLTFFDNHRKRLRISGNVDLRFSERNQFRFELRRQDVAYSGVQTDSRNDFDETAFAVGLIRRVDERNTVSARVTVSEFVVPANGNTTDTVGIEGSFTRPLAPTWNMSLTAGVQRSEYDFLQGQSRVRNAAASPQISVAFRKRAERTQWNLNLSHSVQAWGNGFLGIRDDIRAYVDHQFSPRLGGRFGIRLSENKTLDDVRVADNRNYDRIEMGLEYAVKPTLFVYVGYDFYQQKFVMESDSNASTNSLYFGVSYRGRSRRNQ
jgi:hypothetical protein